MKANLASISIWVATVSVLSLSALALAQSRTIRVESNDGKYKYTKVDNLGSVRLVRRLSSKPCVEGRSWGSDNRGIWVNYGCRAEFEVSQVRPNLRGGGRDRDYGRDRDRTNNGRDWGGKVWDGNNGNNRGLVRKEIKVESDGGKRSSVKISNIGNVRLVRKLSDNPCREGYSWGYSSNRIWVDHGCRGVFEYMKRR